MKTENIFVFLAVFGLSLAVLGSGMFDFSFPQAQAIAVLGEEGPLLAQPAYYLQDSSLLETIFGYPNQTVSSPLAAPQETAIADFYANYIVEFKETPLLEKRNSLMSDVTTIREQARELKAEASITSGSPRMTKTSQANALDAMAVAKENEMSLALSKQKSLIASEQNAALADLTNRIVRKDRMAVGQKYSSAINAVVMTLSDSDLENIKKSPYVSKVSKDETVYANLMDSVPLINATGVWKMVDANGQYITGKGTTIAIVDTGIDYTHPDLGGCFGPTCKVVGGWDFQNNDADPKDDMGHGTHCAAIAASNGTLKGVAPDAKLYAYKVLNSRGSGYMSTVIAGIERAMDPNNDGDYSDHADVISMSLGAYGGTPDDPASVASDRAVDAGVVVVVAAGNSGPSYYSVGSPGTARKVITIGASSKDDQIAYFSSRGPVYWNGKYLAKPDVVAPGYYICAAEYDSAWSDRRCFDDKHVNISGTSMATPHVAGLAALVIQAHPDWTSTEVKMAIKAKAKNLTSGGDIFTQGQGRVDAVKTVNLVGYPPIGYIEPLGIVRGNLSVRGSAGGRDFGRWELYYGSTPKPETMPSNWTKIASGTGVVDNGTMANLDTTLIDDAMYTLKLIVWNKYGESITEYAFFGADNLYFSNPKSGDIYKPGIKLNITATIYGAIKNIAVSWGNTATAQSDTVWSTSYITMLKNGQVLDEPIATWDTTYLEEKRYVLRITVEYLNRPTVTNYITGIYFEKNLKEGWPVYINWQNAYDAVLQPVVEDINNDGMKEILFVTAGYPPKIYAYSTNGRLLWSRGIGTDDLPNGNIAPLTLGDINNDGFKEMIFYQPNFSTYGSGDEFLRKMGLNLSELYAFNPDGSLLWMKAFPLINSPTIMVEDVNADGNKEIVLHPWLKSEIIVASNQGSITKRIRLDTNGYAYMEWSFPALGNLDSDPQLEIAVLASKLLNPGASSPLDYIYQANVFVYNPDGSILPGWPVKIGDYGGEGSVSIADINNDSLNEVIAVTPGAIFAISPDGKPLPGWDPAEYIWTTRPPSVGDLDGDGYLEVSVPEAQFTRVFDHNGRMIYSAAVGNYAINEVFDPSLFVYLDKPFVMRDVEIGNVYAWDLFQNMPPGFPLITEPNLLTSPTVDDIDNDGKVEIITASNWGNNYERTAGKGTGAVYVWDLDIGYNPSKMYWQRLQHDVEQTGWYRPTMGVSPNVPNDPLVYINSSGENHTSRDSLTCYATITDPNGDRLNVSVNWYRNSTLQSSYYFNNNYASGSLVTATLGAGNLSEGDVWQCEMRLSDGASYSSWVKSGVIQTIVTCSDKTFNNQCSAYRPKYCGGGTLSNNCSLCGCPSMQRCNATTQTCSLPAAGETVELFYDEFETSSSLKNWVTASPTKWSISTSAKYNLTYGLAGVPTAYSQIFLQRFQSTVGYSNIVVSFWAKSRIGYGNLTVGYYVTWSSESVSYELAKPGLYGQFYKFNLPASASNQPQFQIALACTEDGGGNECYMDTVRITGITVGSPSCSDGTPYGQCSATVSKYCDNGNLVNRCDLCSCPAGQTCDLANKSCYFNISQPVQTCSDGTPYGWCSLTKPRYCDKSGNLANRCSACGCNKTDWCNYSTQLCQPWPWGQPSNKPPETPAPSLSSFTGSNSTKDDLKCSAVINDPDGNVMNASLKWYRNDSNVLSKDFKNNYASGARFEATLLSGNLSAGNVWKCALQLFDGTDYSGWGVSNTVTILSPYPTNHPPVVSQPSLVSSSGKNTTTDDLICSSTINDPDGDLTNMTVKWYKSSSLMLTVTQNNITSGQAVSAALKSGNLSIADVWQCKMIATDGTLNSSEAYSNTIRVLAPPGYNNPPISSYPKINSSDGSNTVTGDLNCYDTISDSDGDKLNATVNWFKNGKQNLSINYGDSYLSGTAFNSILLKGNLTVGDQWLCSMRLFDGKDYNQWANSTNLTIFSPPAPPTPPTPPSPPGGGGGGGGGGGAAPPSGGGTIVTPPKPACVNSLEVTVPDQIFVPQRVTKQISVVVKNTGTCRMSSVSATLSMPSGIQATSFIINDGLEVNESRTIGLTLLPTDIEPGQYSAMLKLDAPNATMSKRSTVWLLENPPYVVSQEGPSASRIFEYIIALILIEFVFGSIVMVVWYKPPEEKLPPLPQLGSDLKPIEKSDTFRFR